MTRPESELAAAPGRRDGGTPSRSRFLAPVAAVLDEMNAERRPLEGDARSRRIAELRAALPPRARGVASRPWPSSTSRRHEVLAASSRRARRRPGRPSGAPSTPTTATTSPCTPRGTRPLVRRATRARPPRWSAVVEVCVAPRHPDRRRGARGRGSRAPRRRVTTACSSRSTRWPTVKEIDTENQVAVVEPGVTLRELDAALAGDRAALPRLPRRALRVDRRQRQHERRRHARRAPRRHAPPRPRASSSCWPTRPSCAPAARS